MRKKTKKVNYSAIFAYKRAKNDKKGSKTHEIAILLRSKI